MYVGVGKTFMSCVSFSGKHGNGERGDNNKKCPFEPSGPCGPGPDEWAPYGPPGALAGRALMGPAHMGRAFMGPPGPLLAGPGPYGPPWNS